MEVVVASATDGEPISGVAVTAVTPEGFVLLGTTDATGRLSMTTESLQGLRPIVLIFCHDLFFCGATKVLGSEDFFEYTEHYIQLAPGAFL